MKIITVCSAGVWLLSVVMIFIFPRQRYPVPATIFAVLFWLSLIVSCFFAYLLISSIRQRKKRQRRRKRPSLVIPPGDLQGKRGQTISKGASSSSSKTNTISSAKEQDHSEVIE